VTLGETSAVQRAPHFHGFCVVAAATVRDCENAAHHGQQVQQPGVRAGKANVGRREMAALRPSPKRDPELISPSF